MNPLLWGIPLVLSSIGILLIVSTTGPNSFNINGSPYQMGLKQLQWLVLGFLAMGIFYNIPLKLWYKISAPLLIFSWFLTWLPKVPVIGVAVGGARRWIHIPGLPSIQPSELLCLALALHIAKLLSRKNDKSEFSQFLSIFVLFLLCALPVISQPDLGTTMVLFVISMGMFIERKGWTFPIIGGLIAGMGLVALIMIEPYRMRRVTAFLNPWSDPLNKGYQAIQGLIAFANGGLWGSGLGHGFQKLNYLPAAYTDFIFAAVAEEMGFMGAAFILAIFAFWLAQVAKIYFRCDEGYMASLCWGLVLTILFPLVINVCGVTKLLPLTGMPFPFLSYGGTSLLAMWGRIGIIARIEKECVLYNDDDE